MAIFNSRFTCWEEAFSEAITSIGGILPKEIIADGTIHRFSFNGRRGNDSGWYVIFHDEIVGGSIGSWGTGQKINWHYIPNGYDWSPEQESMWQKKTEQRHKEAESLRVSAQEKTAKDAQKRWDELNEAPNDHPYLVLKGVRPHGIKMGKGRLYLPMLDEKGTIVSLQSIDDKGSKLFMKGGRVKGCYFIIGTPTDRLLIAEGYATAASIYEATGLPIAVVFNSGNMISAIQSLKSRFPSLAFKICADNDVKGIVNSGIQAALDAQDELGIDYIYPEFTEKEIERGASDFNDYDRIYGKDKLKQKFSDIKESKFKPLSFSDVVSLPKPRWLIEDIFTFKSFGVIYGKPESCKTFVALDMALCIAHGLQWHGRDVIQGSVLYVVGEGIGGLGKRLKAWTAQFMPQQPEPPFYAITANVNFRDTQDVSELLSAIDNLNQRFSLVIIDTIARALLGGEENSSVDMGMFVNACDTIKEKSGSTVLGVHHCGKDEERGMRGSTALLGAVDTVIYAEQEQQGVVTLFNEKQKDGEHFKDIVFNTIQIATGLRETSLILEPCEEVGVYQKKVNGKSDLYLEALLDCISSDTKTLNGCPATSIGKWRDLCARKNLGGDNPDAMRKGFYRARIRLQDSKVICVDGDLVSYTKEM